MSVKVGVDDVVATYNVYYKNVDGQVQETNFLSNIEMHTYDPVFTYKNVNNPVVVRIQITSPSLYEASTESNSSLVFKLSRSVIEDTNEAEGNRKRTSHYISSIMDFGMAIEDSDNNPRTIEEIYTNAYNKYFSQYSAKEVTPVFNTTTITNAQTFVTNTTGTAGAYDKVEELSFTLNYNKNSWKPSDNPHTLIFYLLINYDHDRVKVDGFAETDLSKGVVTTVSELKNDLDIITVEN